MGVVHTLKLKLWIFWQAIVWRIIIVFVFHNLNKLLLCSRWEESYFFDCSTFHCSQTVLGEIYLTKRWCWHFLERCRIPYPYYKVLISIRCHREKRIWYSSFKVVRTFSLTHPNHDRFKMSQYPGLMKGWNRERNTHKQVFFYYNWLASCTRIKKNLWQIVNDYLKPHPVEWYTALSNQAKWEFSKTSSVRDRRPRCVLGLILLTNPLTIRPGDHSVDQTARNRPGDHFPDLSHFHTRHAFGVTPDLNGKLYRENLLEIFNLTMFCWPGFRSYYRYIKRVSLYDDKFKNFFTRNTTDFQTVFGFVCVISGIFGFVASFFDTDFQN